MKKIFKALMLVLFVGGWALASSAIYAVRIPNSKMPIFMTKNQFAFKDTYLDTRAWTLSEDRDHPEFLARVIQLNRCEVLAHTVNSALGPVDIQLTAAAATPTVAGPNLTDKAKPDVKNASDGIKAKVNN